jgi:nitrite reductase/ring-hydroxylating ferredoxin subunit
MALKDYDEEIEQPAYTKEPVVAQVGEIGPGATKKFIRMVNNRETECFIVNYNGQLFAYMNSCRHVPMTMDWVENQFLNEDGRYILCATHGAAYEPDTGECVFGPPCGQFLARIPLEIVGNDVIAGQPIEDED